MYYGQKMNWLYLRASFYHPHRIISDESTGLRGACPGEEVEGKLYVGALLPDIPFFLVLSSYTKFPICLPGTTDEVVP